MKHLKLTLSVLTFASLLIILIINCDKNATAPERDNPLDGNNPQTSGNPFQLKAAIAGGGVALSWTAVQMSAVKGYNIYRSESASSNFAKINSTPKNITTYTDQTIKNGHSYWYKVTAYTSSGKESSQTNVAAVRIDANPVIIINGDDQYTAKREVTLTILAATATQMWLSNSADFSDGNWESYATSKAWRLPDGDGSKTVYLEIKYNDNNVSKVSNDNIILDTTLPSANFTVSPDSGITNETIFSFDASQSHDNYDLKLRWDYDNNGTFDTYWLTEKSMTYKYSVGGGDKTVKLEVKDGAGNTNSTTKQVFVNTRPSASFTVTTQAEGDASDTFSFDASACSDYEDNTNSLQVRWDWNGDGSYDTNYATAKTATHQYSSSGTKNVILQVKDSSGLTDTASQKIEVIADMVYIPAGSFTIGDTWGEGGSDEKPTHQVTLNSFYIGKYEVTQKKYQEIMGANPSHFKGDNHPVEWISWDNAVKFCNKLSEREGRAPCYTINGTDVTCDFCKNGYRLPTEAEWEYAARGGSQSQGYKYSGSNNPDDVAWYDSDSGGQTHDVGTKQPNELGIYDMSGNVWELCWDWYSGYSSEMQTNPKGPGGGSVRVLRGGSWNYYARGVRVASRYSSNPSDAYDDLGFRLVRTR